MARWHIGSNEPGEMPYEPPYCVEGSWRDAVRAARAEARVLVDCGEHSHRVTGRDGDYWIESRRCGLWLHVWVVTCETPAECEEQ